MEFIQKYNVSDLDRLSSQNGRKYVYDFLCEKETQLIEMLDAIRVLKNNCQGQRDFYAEKFIRDNLNMASNAKNGVLLIRPKNKRRYQEELNETEKVLKALIMIFSGNVNEVAQKYTELYPETSYKKAVKICGVKLSLLSTNNILCRTREPGRFWIYSSPDNVLPTFAHLYVQDN